MQEVGCERVYFIIRKRTRCCEGHGTPDVVEQRSGIRPVAPDCAVPPCCQAIAKGEGIAFDSAYELVVRAALAGGSMAESTLLGIQYSTFIYGAASGRQPLTIRSNVDVPGSDFLGCSGAADVEARRPVFRNGLSVFSKLAAEAFRQNAVSKENERTARMVTLPEGH